MNISLMLISLLILVFAGVCFSHVLDRRALRAREVVMIAVLSSIAVLVNILCTYTIPLHAGTAVIVIAGIAFGPRAGFLTGALARFVCNFLVGQGIWTPWEMVAWGLLGSLAGVMFYTPEVIGCFEDKKALKRERAADGIREIAVPVVTLTVMQLIGYLSYILFSDGHESYFGWRLYTFGLLGIIISVILMRTRLSPNFITVTVFTFISVFVIYGGIMNFAAFVMNSFVGGGGAAYLSLENLKLLYITGAPYDAWHAFGASVCIFLFGDSLIQKLERVRIKFGLCSETIKQ